MKILMNLTRMILWSHIFNRERRIFRELSLCPLELLKPFHIKLDIYFRIYVLSRGVDSKRGLVGSSRSFSFKFALRFIENEPFGLGRFATDHSLTKAASRPLFARVRRYAPQRNH